MPWAWGLVLGLVLLSRGDEHTHKYEEGDEVLLWANKVGPFNNPLEARGFLFVHVGAELCLMNVPEERKRKALAGTYEYFSLPLCRPKTDEWTEKFPPRVCQLCAFYPPPHPVWHRPGKV